MDRAQDYLSRADEAERKAKDATGPYRQQMLDVAWQWRELARQATDLANDEARARENKANALE